jgi:hypothetical protein
LNESKLVTKENKSTFEKTANNEITMTAARELGIRLINIQGDDLTKGITNLVLGLM